MERTCSHQGRCTEILSPCELRRLQSPQLPYTYTHIGHTHNEYAQRKHAAQTCTHQQHSAGKMSTCELHHLCTPCTYRVLPYTYAGVYIAHMYCDVFALSCCVISYDVCVSRVAADTHAPTHFNPRACRIVHVRLYTHTRTHRHTQTHLHTTHVHTQVHHARTAQKHRNRHRHRQNYILITLLIWRQQLQDGEDP